jgi:hypothetical protein
MLMRPSLRRELLGVLAALLGRRRWLGLAAAARVADGLLDRRHDVVVARAAAQVARQRLADLVLGGLRVVLEQVPGGHDHPGRAVAALQAVLLPEGGLHRVEVPLGADALDGGDSRAVRLDGEQGARLDRLAVDGAGAGAAVGGVTPDVGARETEVLAKEVDEQEPWLHVRLARFPVHVDADADGACHERLLPEVGRAARGDRNADRPVVRNSGASAIQVCRCGADG